MLNATVWIIFDVFHVCWFANITYHSLDCWQFTVEQFTMYADVLWLALQDPQSGKYHQIWFDDVQSLRIKYKLAKELHLLGVGIWEADSLDYSDSPDKRAYVHDMWSTLPSHYWEVLHQLDVLCDCTCCEGSVSINNRTILCTFAGIDL